MKEGRQKATIVPLKNLVDFNPRTYFWGNIPEYDLLNLEKNEGGNHDKDLNICFAGECWIYSLTIMAGTASRDLRNVMKTVIALPPNFKSRCDMIINYVDLDVVLRNVTILLLVFLFPDGSAS